MSTDLGLDFNLGRHLEDSKLRQQIKQGPSNYRHREVDLG